MRFLISLSLLGLAGHANACIDQAAHEYGLHPMLLQSVMMVEGGKLGFSRNTNGSYDLGPMQINSTWLPKLAPYGITARSLAYDTCMNVRTGAWILKSEIVKAGGDVWQGIGNYHSHTPKFNLIYRNKVAAALRRIQAGDQDGPR